MRDLGVFIDADLTMHQHVNEIVSRWFAALRQLRAVRRYVSASVMQSLVTSLILTRLDYCNSVLFGLPAIQIRRLQAVQNAAARLVFGIRRSEHISDALIQFTLVASHLPHSIQDSGHGLQVAAWFIAALHDRLCPVFVRLGAVRPAFGCLALSSRPTLPSLYQSVPVHFRLRAPMFGTI
jgi:hypothetical protein